MEIRELAGFKIHVETDIERYRYSSFYWKEPETLSWIDSFIRGATLFDVGANIGIYSFYATVTKDCRCYVFEPQKSNISRLAENATLNGFKKVSPFVPCAIADFVGETVFNPRPETGASGGQMDDETEGSYIVPVYTIDKLASMYGCPDYVKIDIDGQEWRVVHGMTQTLKNPSLESVLIEINDHKDEIIEVFQKAGFTLDNRFNRMDTHSRYRREKEGINCENVIFTR